jgi:hypothetical protein
MSRYIDAEKIKYTNFTYGIVFTTRLDNITFKEDIDAIPTADVAPVRHGHWLRPFPATPKSYVRICSVCKGKAYAIGKEYDYCPNCQAVMDEEVEQ